MKDEIIKNIIYRLDCKSPTAYDEIELSKEESNLLLDYITNLQEENEKLKELCNKYEEEHNTTFIEWKKDIKANKKAIEYIGQHFIEEGSCEINKITGEYTCEGNENFLEDLLDILQGSDKSEK